MRRRGFLELSGVAAIVLPCPAFAQKDLPLIALLFPATAIQATDRIAAIRKGLREAGLAEGVNYAFAMRFADGVYDRVPGLALELAALKPRVIVVASVAVAVRKAVADLPIVFTAFAADPINLGLAESYVHPGGNTTGNVLNAAGGEEALTQKRIGLFRELVPDLKRLGFVGPATSVLAVAELNALRSVAGHFGIEIVYHAINGIDDIESAVASCNRDGVGAFYVSGDPLLYNYMARVSAIVAAAGKPSFGTYPEWARAGLLMSYSADLNDGWRRAGIYAAKILAGEKPGDLPIEQASKFILVVNGRTAKQLGISVPPTFLADEVIE